MEKRVGKGKFKQKVIKTTKSEDLIQKAIIDQKMAKKGGVFLVIS